MTLVLARRGLLAGLGSLLASPAIVRGESLMRVTSPRLVLPVYIIPSRVQVVRAGVPALLISAADAQWLWENESANYNQFLTDPNTGLATLVMKDTKP